MKATQWLALSIALLSCGLVAAQARQIDQVEQILCEREVGNGRLVVVRGPLITDRPPEPLGRAATNPRPWAGMFDISVELRSSQHPPLRAWARSVEAESRWVYDEQRVLDAIVLPGRFVWAWGTERWFMLLETEMPGPTRYVGFAGGEWSLTSNRMARRVERLTVKLSVNEQGLVEAVVTDTLQGVTRRSLHRQKPNTWSFEMISVTDEGQPIPLQKGRMIFEKALPPALTFRVEHQETVRGFQYEFTAQRGQGVRRPIARIDSGTADTDAQALHVLDAVLVSDHTIAVLLRDREGIRCDVVQWQEVEPRLGSAQSVVLMEKVEGGSVSGEISTAEGRISARVKTPDGQAREFVLAAATSGDGWQGTEVPEVKE